MGFVALSGENCNWLKIVDETFYYFKKFTNSMLFLLSSGKLYFSRHLVISPNLQMYNYKIIHNTLVCG